MNYFKNIQLPWLEQKTIFLARHGSHAYGTNSPTSDLDVRGVAVAPKAYYLGYLNTFEHAVSTSDELDLVVFELQKFINLAAAGNPNTLEVLFTDTSDHLKVTPSGELLLSNREVFLSQKLRHTLSGYAHDQLKRIETHRRWLLNPPKACPERTTYGLPERTVIPADQIATATALIRKQIESWDLDLEPLDNASRIELQNRMATVLAEMQMTSDAQFRAAGRVIGFSENFLELLAQERAYSAAKSEWDKYNKWKTERNSVRAAMEAESGYDRKHGAHLIRLMRTCVEVLTDGVYRVRRPDAEELLEIRNGLWSYDRLMQEAKDLAAKVDAAHSMSSLPREPNRKWLDALCVSIIEKEML